MAILISVDDLKDGMVVSEPVINSFGMTLIPAGSVLRESQKRLLKTWNIRTLSVKSSENEEDIEITEELRAIIEEELSAKLKWKLRNKVEQNLYETAVLHLAKVFLNQSKEN